MNVNTGNHLGTLYVDDSRDPNFTFPTITNEGITGLAPGAISFDGAGLSQLTIASGTGHNTFLVTSTGAGYETVLKMQSQDSVYVGSGGFDVGVDDDIQGDLTIENSPKLVSFDDSLNAANKTIVMGNAGKFVGLGGLATIRRSRNIHDVDRPGGWPHLDRSWSRCPPHCTGQGRGRGHCR